VITEDLIFKKFLDRLGRKMRATAAHEEYLYTRALTEYRAEVLAKDNIQAQI
jgi:hypothetical protein